VRRAVAVGLLVGIWLLAWGEVSFANLAGGLVVAVALLAAFPPQSRTAGEVRFHLLGAARLVAYVVRQLVLSNLVMAREILRRTPRALPGVLAHRLERPSDEVVTVMTSIIALSPGTMTVDVDDDSSTVYVHFFLLSDVDAARAGLRRLERLVVGAIGVKEPV
jgi:multicomponent Na+:H+ antiporter subunit E